MDGMKALGIEDKPREWGSERMTSELKVQLFLLFCASVSKNRLHIEKNEEEGNGLSQSCGVCGHLLT